MIIQVLAECQFRVALLPHGLASEGVRVHQVLCDGSHARRVIFYREVVIGWNPSGSYISMWRLLCNIAAEVIENLRSAKVACELCRPTSILGIGALVFGAVYVWRILSPPEALTLRSLEAQTLLMPGLQGRLFSQCSRRHSEWRLCQICNFSSHPTMDA